MIQPHKEKYFPLYWEMAYAAAKQSYAERKQVGAVIVAPSGMISIGWNGMPAGLDNVCEYRDSTGGLVTNPEVIHAERNAIDKMVRQGTPVTGSLLFVTLSPCLECAKSIHGLGFKHIYFAEMYSGGSSGADFLESVGVPITYANHSTKPYRQAHE